MREQDRTGRLLQQRPRHAAKDLFPRPGVAVATGDDEIGGRQRSMLHDRDGWIQVGSIASDDLRLDAMPRQMRMQRLLGARERGS